MDEMRKECEMTEEALPEETVVRQEQSGGASIVDFNYEKYADVERKAVDTDAAAALGLGIASIVMALIMAPVGIILGVIGIVFSIRGRRNPEKRGMATAGLVCSIIGIVFGVLAVLGSILLFSFIAGDMLFYL